jgi:hypothetical protein
VLFKIAHIGPNDWAASFQNGKIPICAGIWSAAVWLNELCEVYLIKRAF